MIRVGGNLAVVVVLSASVAPANPASKPAATPACDRPAVITATMRQLGEHHASFAIVAPEEIKALKPFATAYVVGLKTSYSSGIPCRELPALVAHELAHIWQGRKYGSGAAASRAYGYELEPIADCAAVLTGWPSFRAYLGRRGYGCTPYELAAARELRRWAQ
ncbi:hypothetical protein OG943_47455 [Amycolatopsis sp. NBC_00345]|uniref:hypothetical protein n=1 Tax=Amycolatopsis sp. NBC_00345 TaxID=2975955 RepID=UPI002E26E6FD